MISKSAGDTTDPRPGEFDHFVTAQAPVYDQVLRELTGGRKLPHWMWFIFPQLRGLGHSSMSERYAIDSLAQARRYMEHRVLGPRLQECTQLVLEVQGRTAEDVFGHPDWMKFRSSMTLFSVCSPVDSLFMLALDKYFAGAQDGKTLRLLRMPGAS